VEHYQPTSLSLLAVEQDLEQTLVAVEQVELFTSLLHR
jgi:hypothetical protein